MNMDILVELLTSLRTCNQKKSKDVKRIQHFLVNVQIFVISHINDSFFAPYEEDGQIFYLRRTNLQRDDGRTLNIIDEIEVEE